MILFYINFCPRFINYATDLMQRYTQQTVLVKSLTISSQYFAKHSNQTLNQICVSA